jgi:hypothetical protein
MRRNEAKFVPRLLTNDRKQRSVNVCLELRDKANEDPTFISRIALFPKLKMKLMGRRFETVSDIQRESQPVLDSIKEDDFHGAFEAWKKRRDRCISSQGDYFEGYGSQN